MRISRFLEVLRAYTANEEPMDTIELWCHYQDEQPVFLQKYDTLEVAKNRGIEFSHNPIVYGTVILTINKIEIGRFISGKFYGAQQSNDVKFQQAISDYYHDDRPDWNEYFLRIAQDVSLRSEDLFIKHGCVLVDKKTQHIIGTGYNGLPKGVNKLEIDLSNRDARRDFMIHSEMNAILNSTRNPLELSMGAKAYVTGRCCNFCLQHLIQFGVNEIYELDQAGSITEDSKYQEQRQKILSMNPLVSTYIVDPNSKWLRR